MSMPSPTQIVRDTVLNTFNDGNLFTAKAVALAAGTKQNLASAALTKLRIRGAVEVVDRFGSVFRYRVLDASAIESITGKATPKTCGPRKVGPRITQRMDVPLAADFNPIGSMSKRAGAHFAGNIAQRVRRTILEDFLGVHFTVTDISNAIGITQRWPIKAVSTALSNLAAAGALEKIGEDENRKFVYRVLNSSIIQKRFDTALSKTKPRPTFHEQLSIAGEQDYFNSVDNEMNPVEDAGVAQFHQYSVASDKPQLVMVNELLEIAIGIERDGVSRAACIKLVETALAVMKKL